MDRRRPVSHCARLPTCIKFNMPLLISPLFGFCVFACGGEQSFMGKAAV